MTQLPATPAPATPPLPLLSELRQLIESARQRAAVAVNAELTLLERTAISRKPIDLLTSEITQLRQSGELTPALLLKDSYVLDFLGLNDRYLEKDLEDAILREMEQFLLELGAGFTLVARQKRVQIDNDDFYIDLLFYNRKLKRLVAVELKIDVTVLPPREALQAKLNQSIEAARLRLSMPPTDPGDQ